MAGLNYEVITDEGFLNNPYRSVRYLDDTERARLLVPGRGLSGTPATSNAVAHRRPLLPAVPRRGPRRVPLLHRHLGHRREHRVRSATRTPGASAGSSRSAIAGTTSRRRTSTRDLFPRENAQNFLARDKELSTFTSHMLSLGATYELPALGWDRIAALDGQPVLRPHPLRLRGLPRHPHRRRAGHRAAVRLRRRRDPPVLLGLVLGGSPQRSTSSRASRSALPGACGKNSDGSVISSSSTTGAPCRVPDHVDARIERRRERNRRIAWPQPAARSSAPGSRA